MSNELMLVLWTGLGLGWWMVSWWLAAEVRPTTMAAPIKEPDRDEPRPRLVIFKPLPPLAGPILREATAIESFVAQMDGACEMLLGIEESGRAAVLAFVEEMAGRYPHAKVTPVFRSERGGLANPKVAWLRVLAQSAGGPSEGELWLWSDVDMIAPAGFLREARRELALGKAGLVTWPYVIRATPRVTGLLDALFVNVEFTPGVVLMRRVGLVDFAFGAAMLFRRADFFEKMGWEELGAWLADDFALGQKLQPVRIGRATLETVPDEADGRGALLHYLRWSKTIFWNRTAGVAAKLFVLPGLGWAGALCLHPHEAWLWAGLVFTLQMDVAFAFLISRRAGCECPLRWLPWVEFWSVWRLAVWAACWFPWPVVWRGERWWAGKK